MKSTDAVRLLEECEQGLRKLVSEAAAEGDYASVQRIADLAKAIKALAAEGQSTPSNIIGASIEIHRDGNFNHAKPSFVAPANGRKARPANGEYPKFFQRGDELVKVGWSKKERKEYHHRAPRGAIDAVAAAVRHIGAKRKLFNGDALLPLKDLTDGHAIPDYQAYVALAWLKHLGVVEQRGRRAGYTLAPEKQVESIITAAWPQMAEWHG